MQIATAVKQIRRVQPAETGARTRTETVDRVKDDRDYSHHDKGSKDNLVQRPLIELRGRCKVNTSVSSIFKIQIERPKMKPHRGIQEEQWRARVLNKETNFRKAPM